MLGALAIVLSAVVLWALTFTPCGEYKRHWFFQKMQQATSLESDEIKHFDTNLSNGPGIRTTMTETSSLVIQ